ncbi:MAG: outer membrane protein OmpA-like peptidoglycan-associated protein [Francisellaceae bacterium]|jgi:outer membrane protein OmpA-like peptidoglycan-associated protein
MHQSIKVFIIGIILFIVGGCISKPTSPLSKITKQKVTVNIETTDTQSPPKKAEFIIDQISDPTIKKASVEFETITLKKYSLDSHHLYVAKLRGGLLFDFNKSDITSVDNDDIKAFSKLYKQGRLGEHLYVIGHTDSVGSSTYNQSLSARRAWFIASLLVKSGVKASAIKLVPAGESQPIVTNRTLNGRTHNRRVEIMSANSRELLSNYFRQIKCPDNSCEKFVLPVIDIINNDGRVLLKYNKNQNIATLSPELNDLRNLSNYDDTRNIDKHHTKSFFNDHNRLKKIKTIRRQRLKVPITIRNLFTFEAEIRKPLILPSKYLYSAKKNGE